MSADEGTTPTGNPGSTEQLICRICGYDLTHLDWTRAEYRCPECGQVNIPHDAHVGPLTPRRWPSPVWSGLLLLWPGLGAGLGITVGMLGRADWAQLLGIFLAMLCGAESLAWPWVGAAILLYERLPERERARYMPWLPLGAILGNVLLAGVVTRAALGVWR